jgi:hypothetical protein
LSAESPGAAVRLWTAKEAVGKLSGLGLLDGHAIGIALPVTRRWARGVDAQGRACVVRGVDTVSGDVLTVAARRPVSVQAAYAVGGPTRPSS